MAKNKTQKRVARGILMPGVYRHKHKHKRAQRQATAAPEVVAAAMIVRTLDSAISAAILWALLSLGAPWYILGLSFAVLGLALTAFLMQFIDIGAQR